ncbi:hypothetical protein P7K49_015296 [Saguinus oedipus]|uniref:Uncharacterized protein n=1 Tax=Saguinus oedipus TaxID=9490 RepID=A0ABQ9V8U2_SAGOE|nr:hypothetical protein P7K49_015296 [Saguinus oedipus]
MLGTQDFILRTAVDGPEGVQTGTDIGVRKLATTALGRMDGKQGRSRQGEKPKAKETRQEASTSETAKLTLQRMITVSEIETREALGIWCFWMQNVPQKNSKDTWKTALYAYSNPKSIHESSLVSQECSKSLEDKRKRASKGLIKPLRWNLYLH